MPKKLTLASWLQNGLIRVCRIHFILAFAYAIYTIGADATRLITPEFVVQRWMVTSMLVVASAVLWYAARHTTKNPNYYRVLIYILILCDIGFATFNVYTQRGMASRAVILYVVPLVVSALLLSRVALMLTATLATSAYVVAAVKYFVDFFNEGYKAELYLELAFYSVVIFLTAGLLSHLVKFSRPEADLSL